MENTMDLQVPGSALETLWQEESHMPIHLKQFYTYACMLKLKTIPGSVEWPKLLTLNVSGCSELEELPSMETLVSLEVLSTDGCVKLKSIRGLAQLTKLRLLNVNGCSELEELPSMETLTSLEELRAGGCVKLKNIGGLFQWTKLSKPSFCSFSESEEEGAKHCLSLEMLDVSRCHKLVDVSRCHKLVAGVN